MLGRNAHRTGRQGTLTSGSMPLCQKETLLGVSHSRPPGAGPNRRQREFAQDRCRLPNVVAPDQDGAARVVKRAGHDFRIAGGTAVDEDGHRKIGRGAAGWTGMG